MIGSSLRAMDDPYVASRDDKGTWRILYVHHPSLGVLGPDDEVPDSSPALTVITEGAFIALVREATKLGVLQNAAITPGNAEELEEHIKLLETEKVTLADLNSQLKNELEHLKNSPDSEDFKLKSKVLDGLLKLAMSSDIQKLTSK